MRQKVSSQKQRQDKGERMNESQLRAGNNDGMDPYWKPEPSSEIEVFKIMQEIYRELENVAFRFDKFSEEELDKIKEDKKVLTTVFTVEQVRKIRRTIKSARKDTLKENHE